MVCCVDLIPAIIALVNCSRSQTVGESIKADLHGLADQTSSHYRIVEKSGGGHRGCRPQGRGRKLCADLSLKVPSAPFQVYTAIPEIIPGAPDVRAALPLHHDGLEPITDVTSDFTH